MKFIGRDSKEKIISRFSKHVSSGKVEFFKSVDIDFVFGRREGPYIWDAAGEKRLINCHCNGGVFNLGHRNPQIIQALIESLNELDIGKDETGFMTREGLFHKNSKDSGHYHSNWLSMMYPRLFLARNLLLVQLFGRKEARPQMIKSLVPSMNISLCIAKI